MAQEGLTVVQLKRQVQENCLVLGFQESQFSEDVRAQRTLQDCIQAKEDVVPTIKLVRSASAALIDALEGQADMVEFYSRKLVDFQTRYFALVRVLDTLIEQFAPNNNSRHRNETPQPRRFKPPQISLPEFDGSPDKWLKFRDLFTATIHSSLELSEIEKFQYLETCMKLPSSETNVLSFFQLTAENYQGAWQAVCDRYNDTTRLVNHQIETLFSVKKMANGQASELRRIIDSFSSTLCTLTQLDYPLTNDEVDLSNLLIISMVMHRLDDEVIREWNRSNNQDFFTWETLRAFLIEQWKKTKDVRVRRGSVSSEPKSSRSGKSFVSDQPQAKPAMKCYKCSGAHALWDCPEFKKMSVDERRQVVRESNLCWNCFGKTHTVSKCQSKYRCRTCQKPHHTLVHQTFSTQENPGEGQPQPSTSKPTPFQPPPPLRNFP
jgi:Protein of unknown function (DUF1759)